MANSQIYIHIPYCKGKCIYCDFFSAGSGIADWSLYVRSVLNELETRRGELPDLPHTLYIGGGTPSLIPDVEFMLLTGGVNGILKKKEGWNEFTVEVNPEDVTEEKCRVWRDAGVNRVSMGVQSFVDSELRTIGRRHDSKRAIEAYSLLRREFDNISIDLMFGLPGQDLESWRRSVRECLLLEPDHISAYTLMLESGTPMTVLHKEGRMKLPTDEETVAMWRYLSEELQRHGYLQYEISNYSLPGRESVHNSGYWKGNPYLGLGPSAHSYDGGRVRKANPPRLKEYLKRFGAGNQEIVESFYETEYLDDEEMKEEFIMLRMRMREGIPLDEYRARFGSFAGARLEMKSERFLSEGSLRKDDGHLKLTDDGIMKADSVILALSM